MNVMLLGMFTSFSPVQPSKAKLPINITLLGMFTVLSPEQRENILNVFNVLKPYANSN